MTYIVLKAPLNSNQPTKATAVAMSLSHGLCIFSPVCMLTAAFRLRATTKLLLGFVLLCLWWLGDWKGIQPMKNLYHFSLAFFFQNRWKTGGEEIWLTQVHVEKRPLEWWWCNWIMCLLLFLLLVCLYCTDLTGPTVWNSPSNMLREQSDEDSFKRQLKTFFFSRTLGLAYPAH